MSQYCGWKVCLSFYAVGLLCRLSLRCVCVRVCVSRCRLTARFLISTICSNTVVRTAVSLALVDNVAGVYVLWEKSLIFFIPVSRS